MKGKQTHKKTRATLATHLRRTFVPHKANHYRPHLVRLHGVTGVLVLALFVQLAYGFVTTGRMEVLGRTSNISVTDLWSLTNNEREAASLPDLQLDDQLNRAAYLKAEDMLENNYWDHTSPAGITPWKWLADVEYNYDMAGENLAKNYPSAEATVEAWMNSESHRANILNNNYQDVGFAVVDGMLDGRSATVVVAYYARPVSAAGVQGVTGFAAPLGGGVQPLTYLGTALQSVSPATWVALVMFAVVGFVSLLAHHFRNKLPKAWRQSWKRHHGLYTFIGIAILAASMILATGGGQI